MARVVRFHQTGGPEVLRIEEVEVRPPGKGEVQIRVKALGLNRAESMFRSGQYLEEPKLPARLGYEAAGTVAAIGPGVQGFKVGDAVSTIPSFSLNDYGLYGDLANAPVHAVTHHPASLSWVEAAAVWMQYLTAYGALDRHRRADEGRHGRDPRGVEQRRPGGHPDRQQGRGSPRRPDARPVEAAGPAGCRCGPRDRHPTSRTWSRRSSGSPAARAPASCSTPSAARPSRKLAQATAQLGILFLYGALSTEPTPLPLFDVLGKWATIRGYVMMEITSDPERLEAGKDVRQRRARRRQPQADHRQDVPARPDRRGPPLPGVEPAGRQDRRHGLTPKGPSSGPPVRHTAWSTDGLPGNRRVSFLSGRLTSP